MSTIYPPKRNDEIWIIEDNYHYGEALRSEFENSGSRLNPAKVFNNAQACREGLDTQRPDIVLLDLKVRESNFASQYASIKVGLDLLKHITSKYSDTSTVVMSTQTDNPNVVFHAMKYGAIGFMDKDDHITTASLQDLISRARRSGKMESSGHSIDSHLQNIGTLGGREIEVLELLGEGLSSGEMLQEINALSNAKPITQKTIENCRASVCSKLVVRGPKSLAIL